MPRGGKRGGARAPPRKIPRLRPSGGIANGFIPAVSSSGFTLQDEARSTAHRSSPWSSDSRLRHRPVTFINTGAAEPLKQLENILQKDEEGSTNRPQEAPDGPHISHLQADDALLDDHESASASDEAKVHEAAPADATVGTTDASLDTSEAAQATISQLQDSARTEALSTEKTASPLPFFFDVVGENQLLDTPLDQTPTRSPSPTPSNSSEEVILFRGRNKVPKDRQKLKPKTKSKLKAFNLDGISTEIDVLERTVKSKKNSRGDAPRKTGENSYRQSHPINVKDLKRQEEDDLIADYIANLREYGEDEVLVPVDAYSRRDLGGSLSESGAIEDSFQTVVATSMAKAVSEVDNDLGNTAAEFDVVPRASDPKPLWDAQMQSKRGQITQVDDTLTGIFETDASYLASLEQSNVEDASPNSDSSDQDDVEDNIFTSAADRFANEIDDFDYMDWNRPALKSKKGKGARGKVPVFDVSDSELEGKIQAAWKNDRLKKAERKKERQALRSLGLLGKHANPEDLRVKYPHGMGLEQIADELRTFLLGTHPSLTLPPMDNHARKVIHELASKFNIKSKSTGSGDQRRPILHRTFRTAKFADEVFDIAIARVGRKYFPRNDTTLRAAAQRQSARRGGAGGHAGVVYRDGEVVGGSAPELSQENKGRTMLEKMGWSSGTALGAMNNKGILQPVVHVVKRSKAGLG
ncbi:G-patch domain-containing protein [Colletotrichum orchidophilum]|uniref:Protein SQS1 n=1 Tax=Colletotrichum orchidophilum TaxID=1209926 RepID=A0A1G4BAY3_9PEZI|nr:G-patch domain-containing protein [Colletotrichum orchidophilum]OHE98571.1 G-patch domain-containing protein [Colletotrichum orchidophilum]